MIYIHYINNDNVFFNQNEFSTLLLKTRGVESITRLLKLKIQKRKDCKKSYSIDQYSSYYKKTWFNCKRFEKKIYKRLYYATMNHKSWHNYESCQTIQNWIQIFQTIYENWHNKSLSMRLRKSNDF